MIKLKNIKPDKLVDIITYFSIILFGLTILILSNSKIENNIDFMSNFYYILTLIFIASYFVYRQKQSYEKLFLSLASAIITGLLFLFRDSNSIILLGVSLFLFSILIVTIKSIGIILNKKQKKYDYQFKMICMFFIALIGFLTGYILISQVLSQVIIYGHFFIIFGVLCLFEPILSIIAKEQ